MSGMNVQIAENQRKTDCARACAESGLEIMRFWLNRVSILGESNPTIDLVHSSLYGDFDNNEITNILGTYDFDGTTISIPNVTLNSTQGQTFSVTIITEPNDPNRLRMNVTGSYSSITKTIGVNYEFGTRGSSVFDYGVATKGPLSLTGNVELDGVNVSVESNVYIESESSNSALSIQGNSHIAGNVAVVNPSATVYLQGGNASIGGETGQAAVDNHVTFGVPPSEFPEPNPGYFEQFVVNVVDANTETSADATFENIRILAGTNPNFSGHATLKGVVFIETPNVITFTGSADIIAIIVGDGTIEDNSGTNRLIFQGNVSSLPVSELPDEQQFAGLKDELGTFVLAPGFKLSFGGNFTTLSGAIAGNGIEFYGNAGGTINGTIVNYSPEDMTLTGNSDLYFNRSGTTQAPTGFVPETVLNYDPISYSEIAL